MRVDGELPRCVSSPRRGKGARAEVHRNRRMPRRQDAARHDQSPSRRQSENSGGPRLDAPTRPLKHWNLPVTRLERRPSASASPFGLVGRFGDRRKGKPLTAGKPSQPRSENQVGSRSAVCVGGWSGVGSAGRRWARQRSPGDWRGKEAGCSGITGTPVAATCRTCCLGQRPPPPFSPFAGAPWRPARSRSPRPRSAFPRPSR